MCPGSPTPAIAITVTSEQEVAYAVNAGDHIYKEQSRDGVDALDAGAVSSSVAGRLRPVEGLVPAPPTEPNSRVPKRCPLRLL